jgi:serine/threonine-protein kinase
MMAHLFSPPPRVTEAVPSLPAALDHVIAIAMAKDPAARFPSAGALAEAAAAALHDPTRQVPLPPVPRGEVSTYPPAGPPGSPWWEHSGPRTMASWPGSAPPVAPGRPPAAPKRRRRMVIGAAVAAVVVIATAVTVAAWPEQNTDGTASGPPPSPQGPPATDVTATQLRPILLTGDEIASAAKGQSVVLETDGSSLSDDAATVDNPQCLGAWAPAQQAVYARSGYTGVAAQQLRSLNENAWQDSVNQAVIAFPSQDSVGISYVNQRGQWGLCGGKPLTVTAPGQPPQTWDFGQPVTASGVLTLTATLRGGTAACQHGILTRGNVLLDIRQCRASGTDVAALVTAASAKVPRQ